MAQVQIMHGVCQARDLLESNGEASGEPIVAQINVLHVAQLRQQVNNVAGEVVGVQIQHLELLEILEHAREPASEPIPGQVEVPHVPQARDPLRDRAVEAIGRQIQVLQRSHCAQCRRDPTREVVPGEAQVPERPEADQGVQLQLAAEAKPVEDDGGDIVVGVAVDAGPAGAGAGVFEQIAGVPCVQDLPERVGPDPFLEFEQGSELRVGSRQRRDEECGYDVENENEIHRISQ